MAKEYTTDLVEDAAIEQVTISRGLNAAGNPEVRVRCNIVVTLRNKLVSTETHTRMVVINETVQTLGIGPQVVAIRNALLQRARSET